MRKTSLKFDKVWAQMISMYAASSAARREGWGDEFMVAEQAHYDAHRTYRSQEDRDLQRMEIMEERSVN